MIIKLEQKIDIDHLRSYLGWVKSICPPFMKKNGPWGGWSITSTSGEIYDGWQTGEKAYAASTSEVDKKAIVDYFLQNNFNKKTKLYNNDFADLMSSLTSLIPDINLSRIRIALLKPHPEEEAYWHQDSDGRDSFRLHVPIITNDQCFFDYKDERHSLVADGSVYLINVGRLHRAINQSQHDRFHLIADAYKK